MTYAGITALFLYLSGIAVAAEMMQTQLPRIKNKDHFTALILVCMFWPLLPIVGHIAKAEDYLEAFNQRRKRRK